MRTDDLDFELPPELIAQDPPAERSASRLLHYWRDDRSIAHQTFAELPSLLRAGDLLVFNDTRVLPARFMLRKETGGLVEGLFLSQAGANRWRVLLKNAGRTGGRLHFDAAPDLSATIVQSGEAGEHEIELNTDEPAEGVLGRIGRMPLPPYIKREKGHDRRDESDRNRYQTVYASTPGAVAAPTAGLHFTDDLLAQLKQRGVQQTFVTLHVGIGTFKPVVADTLEGHAMHSESYEIGDEAAAALNRAKGENRRIIAVGTTSARVLESQAAAEAFRALRGDTSIFIYPPYRARHIGGLITNFHLPRSTLIALVAALTGLEEQRRIYREAIERRYRFFSYGDAMLIE
jgi:S-adenosylmethionine:tRNA ribosyltransferase-isomerase